MRTGKELAQEMMKISPNDFKIIRVNTPRNKGLECYLKVTEDAHKKAADSKLIFDSAATKDRTKLYEWGSPKGLPKGWQGRVLKG